MNIIYRLRSKYDEAYRIRHGWGLSPIRNKREMKALVQFCKSELNEPYMPHNPYKKQLFEATIALAEGKLEDLPLEFKKREYINISEIIREYTDWYWS